MKEPIYYPEEELVRRMDEEHLSKRWYIRHHSPEMREDYKIFCQDNELNRDREESAEAFFKWVEKKTNEDMW